ncbi:hypothetical protein FRACYDRAFT_246369 [Fragilariopsis cylindrus CCMP1102]|uniref:Uncharacterized protein n=1 Tax=Fragilariopsis cylindrus CCMP1102 TaxID=635003 RepID=A0A1E7EZH6_9STRA|nr:hypothetical protein FRACYDRAFT_246369 [Fragilariopsis cylindrus CCMP1102]|eukprot:OEU11256.1 hypothetical protein FRACYDRAFT_246369 [Fragilariopsis cylindrus CCMP1102]
MSLLSVANNVTVKALYRASAKFLCPSEEEWEEWEEEGGLFSTVAKGIVTIQEQVSQDGSVYFVRWRNYMGVDRLNGRILHGLPILRQNKSVYFKTSSITTRGDRRNTTVFGLKFETVDKAEEFEVFWLWLNGSIGDDDAEDRNKMPAVTSTPSASASTVPSSCTTLRPQQTVPLPAQANAAPSPNDVASPANTATGGCIAAIGGIIAFMIDCCTDCCCEDALEEIELQEDFNVVA